VKTDGQACSNCGVPSSTQLCSRCQTLTTCRRCKRHLPAHCFDSSSSSSSSSPPCNGHATDNKICQACKNKGDKRTTTALGNIISETTLPTHENDITVEGFFNANAEQIQETIEHARAQLRSVRVQLRIDILFSRQVDNQTRMQTAMGYFSTRPEEVNSSSPEIDINAAIANINNQIEHFNSRGSGYRVQRIMKFAITITKFRPLHGSTYIPTPPSIAKKHCTINVNNANDNKCCLWSILAALYPSKTNRNNVYTYRKYEKLLNMTGINFPVQTRQIPQIERQNPFLSVNVFFYDTETKGFCVEYRSPEGQREKHVNLLLLEGENGKHHYVCITNMSRLVSHRTNHQHATHVCNSCLHPFDTQQSYDNHRPYCLKQPAQMIKYPNANKEKECTLKFRAHRKQYKLPFYLVADFESFLTTPSESEFQSPSHVVNEHQISGFACHRVTHIDEYKTAPIVYSGDDVMSVFYEHVMKEAREMSNILGVEVPMLPLTPQQIADYDEATHCGNCNVPFSGDKNKVHHHCHVTGNYLFAAFVRCNLQLKQNKRQCVRAFKHPEIGTNEWEEWYGDIQELVDAGFDLPDCDQSGSEQDDADKFFLPVVFHNLTRYDGHFIIKHFDKKYVERRNAANKATYGDVNVIPLNSEKYVMFEIGYVRFLDSYQFLSASLDNLVSGLLKSGRENFVNTKKYLEDHDLVFAKGIYPYSYMTSPEKFKETKLPPIDAFYDSLNDQALDPKDYERAQETWSHFKMHTLKEYHDHYLLLDTLLLADIFENFRNSIMEGHQLDPLHFLTLPSLAWAMALKHTGTELRLITDANMYLMIESGMRGGIATISNRHAKANNPHVAGYDQAQPTQYITYLDANNLYGAAQSEMLPVGGFKYLTADEVAAFDLMSVTPDSQLGYILECDLAYPSHLHDTHSDYPLAPEHMLVTKDMLSPYALQLLDDARSWVPTEKLIPNLMNKTKYVVHYRNLQFYVKHNLVVTKIHRIVSFFQRRWLKPWIDVCTRQRMMARSDFEADLAKLQANATFGKTMENVRNRVNVRLIADPDKLTKAVSKPSFRQSEIINQDLVMVKAARVKIMLNKPIAVGFAILELSKLIMYEFYYDVMKRKYGDKCSLLFTDTDSLCMTIQTDDWYADMQAMQAELDYFDTSNFERDHELFSSKNHRVLGKFKSETGSLQPVEFVGLKAKMYSLDVCPKKSHIKVKGIKKRFVKKNVRHSDFVAVLQRQQTHTTATFRNFRSTNHVLETVEMTKLCLDAFDDKR